MQACRFKRKVQEARKSTQGPAFFLNPGDIHGITHCLYYYSYLLNRPYCSSPQTPQYARQNELASAPIPSLLPRVPRLRLYRAGQSSCPSQWLSSTRRPSKSPNFITQGNEATPLYTSRQACAAHADVFPIIVWSGMVDDTFARAIQPDHLRPARIFLAIVAPIR